MSFDVELTEPLIRTIAGWKLPGRLQSEILERIYEVLAESPIRHLKRLPPPADIMEFSFCVVGEGDPPLDYLFSFAVVYAADEQTIIVKDGSILTI